MSSADARRIIAAETTIDDLLARVAALEDMVADSRAFCEARQRAKTPAGDIGSPDRRSSSQRPARRARKTMA
jgi:hypothetical protein